MKNKIIALACAASLFALSACTGSQGPVAPVAGTAVTGVAAKGPYQAGSTVTVLTVPGGAVVATGTVADALGNYSVSIPNTAVGPFEIQVSGTYIDETTGQPSTAAQTTSVIIADAATAPAKLSVNPIASIQAEIVKAALTANPNANVAQEIASAGTLALQALGIPTTDAAGNPVDPAQIDILDPAADPSVTTSAVTASAIVAELAKGGTSVAAFAAGAAADITAGNAIGTSSGTTAAITAAANTVAALPVVTNLTSGITAAGGTAPAIATTDAAVQTGAAGAATSIATLTGFAIAANTFTVGGVTATVAATGVTSAITGVPANGVVVSIPLVDYGAGTGPQAQAISTSFDFDIADAAPGTRSITGTVSPVDVVADGTGNVTVTVPANATLTWSGTTAAGTAVSGVATNLTLNTVFTTPGLTVDANALLNQITAKINNAALNLLSTAGTFNFAFGIGINLGHENAGANGIDQLFPATNVKVAGRAISGTITTN